MEKTFSVLCLLFSILCLLAIGCAEVEVPGPKEVISHPFGSQPSALGWTKDEVRMQWGDPDQVIALEPDEWGTPQEEWVYVGRYPDMPIDYKYLSKTQHFYFNGNAVVNMKSEQEKEQGEEKLEKEEASQK